MDQANIDPHFLRQIQKENERKKFNATVHMLTEQCWEICDIPVNRPFDGKTQKCLSNCVDRFIDSSTIVTKHMLSSQGKKTESKEKEESSFFKWN